MSQSTHYHIKWLPSGKLDWQPFTTREDAERMARELVLRKERYEIEPIGGACEICAAVNPRAASTEIPKKKTLGR